ncbi:MAG: PQQ-binding-like beta-propeller repeat protein [Candidatus Zixiibacteriota bacterium]
MELLMVCRALSQIRVAILPLLVILLSCSGGYYLTEQTPSGEMSWPFHRNSLSATGYVQAGSFEGKLDILWERGTSGKPAGPLTLYQETLIYPDTKNRIRFLDVDTGEKIGAVKSHGAAHTGVVLYHDHLYFATAPGKSRLRCVDLASDDTRWKLPAPDAAAGLLIVEEKLVAAFTNGTLVAYDPEDGRSIWISRFDGSLVAPPSFAHGKIYQPSDNGILYIITPDSGSTLFEVELDGPLVSSVAVTDRLFLADMYGHVYSVDPLDGHRRWSVDIKHPVWTSPAVTKELVVVGHSGGGLVALDTQSGSVVWEFEAGAVIKASPVIVGRFVLVATMSGNLYSLHLTDGRLISKRELGSAIAHSPISDGNRVIVATESGEIVCFGRNSSPNSRE